MINTATSLRNLLSQALSQLTQIADNETSIKKNIDKWSKKEILGHLIDSACNNQQKFVRTMAQGHLDFVGYAQNHWVAVQQYNKQDWQELVQIWYAYNLQIAHIIQYADSATLQHTISIDGNGPFSLLFIMEDYVEHLKHHLQQILPERNWESAFQNVYH